MSGQPAPAPTAEDLRRALSETTTCTETAAKLQVDVRELLRLARAYKIRLPWTRDWAR